MRALPKFLVVAALILAAAPAALHAQERTAPDAAQVEKRLTSVQTLIEKSSAARQIDSSGDAASRERQGKARELHREAEAAYRAGDLVRASTLLDEASKQMFVGVRSAAPEQLAQDKARRDFDERMKSTRALLDALKRISDEKGLGADGRTLVASIESGIAQAVSQAGTSDYVRARASLDQSYLVAKAAIGGLRGGDTLVRSLNFASKEEEFHYEVDRNDTHRMLVTLLVEEKKVAAQGTLKQFVDAAVRLRAEAQQTAGRGDYPGAIRLLEDSTRELVRAIRSAGIYIPG